MSSTGLDSIDKTLQKTNEWLSGLMRDLPTNDRKVAYTALRAVLHALRDRLPVVSVAHLGAQLPLLVRGIYYDGWRPNDVAVGHVRSVEEFLALVERDFPPGATLDSEKAARAVLRVMDQHLGPNAMQKVLHIMPKPIQTLWGPPTEPRDS
jgi:uncharacterized protein (DUF2267 family)